MDRSELINALSQEFHKEDDLIPYVDESKYISSTHSLNCDVIDIDLKDLNNLHYYIEELRKNLEEAGKKDYAKLQSSYYASMANRCVEYVIREKTKQ